MLELARRAEPEPPRSNRATEYLSALEQKVLWLACWMIHHANHIRPSRDGLKVGGHQASCASVATLMTALYLDVLRPGDRVAVKPHASPMFHAIQYLLGRQSAGQARAVPGVRRGAGLSVADQGHRRRRFLHRLGRPRRGDDAFRVLDPGPAARARAAAGGAARPHGRDRGRCRARRGQRLRGAARGLEARRQERLVGDRLQPPEPRPGGARPAVLEDRRFLPRGRLAGGHAQVRQAAPGGVRAARRRGAAPLDRRLPERALLGDHLPGRRRLARASRARSGPLAGIRALLDEHDDPALRG